MKHDAKIEPKAPQSSDDRKKLKIKTSTQTIDPGSEVPCSSLVW